MTVGSPISGISIIFPAKIAVLNDKGNPANAIILILLISLVIPFAGRTAIGWIVDVTTIGATIIYGLVSVAAIKLAREMKDKRSLVTGMAGIVLMLIFGAAILIPTLISRSSLASETFLMFIIWSVLGFLYFRLMLRHDREKRFGTSVIVWVALLRLVKTFSV